MTPNTGGRPVEIERRVWKGDSGREEGFGRGKPVTKWIKLDKSSDY